MEANTTLLNIDHLKALHPALSVCELSELLKFCNDHTIYYLSCYGSGEIMYQKWLQSKINKFSNELIKR